MPSRKVRHCQPGRRRAAPFRLRSCHPIRRGICAERPDAKVKARPLPFSCASNSASGRGMDDIAALKAGLLADIERTETPGQVEELRVGALGKQGVVTALLKTLGGMSPEERQERGPAIHDLREGVTAAIALRKAALEQANGPPCPGRSMPCRRAASTPFLR